MLGVDVGAPIMKVSSRSPRSSDGKSDGRSFQMVLPRSSAPSFFQKNGLSFLTGFGGARAAGDDPLGRDEGPALFPPPASAAMRAARPELASSSPSGGLRPEIELRKAGRGAGGVVEEGESSSSGSFRLEIDERKASFGREVGSEESNVLDALSDVGSGLRRAAISALRGSTSDATGPLDPSSSELGFRSAAISARRGSTGVGVGFERGSIASGASS